MFVVHFFMQRYAFIFSVRQVFFLKRYRCKKVENNIAKLSHLLLVALWLRHYWATVIPEIITSNFCIPPLKRK